MNNATTVTAPATATTAVAPVAVGRGGGSPQVVQVKQEPAPPGNVAKIGRQCTPPLGMKKLDTGQGDVLFLANVPPPRSEKVGHRSK